MGKGESSLAVPTSLADCEQKSSLAVHLVYRELYDKLLAFGYLEQEFRYEVKLTPTGSDGSALRAVWGGGGDSGFGFAGPFPWRSERGRGVEGGQR